MSRIRRKSTVLVGGISYEITPPATLGGRAPELHEDSAIALTYLEFKAKGIDLAEASSRILGEVLPAYATSGFRCANLATARDIIACGPQDEFTEAAVSALQGGGAAGSQQELKGGLRRLVLERDVFHLFTTSALVCRSLEEAYASSKSYNEIVGGGNPMMSERIFWQNSLKNLAMTWGGGIDQRTRGDEELRERLGGNPAYPWYEVFQDDALGYGLILQAMSAEPVDSVVREELDKSGRELCAAGLILAHGNVLDKWDYYDLQAKSNYPKAVERHNGGVDVTLPEVIGRVKLKYPKASGRFFSPG